jgi:uncharacterized surface protein with fasciclin (FAS1) repeats
MRSRGLAIIWIALLATSIAVAVVFLASDENPVGRTVQLGLRRPWQRASYGTGTRNNGKDSSESRLLAAATHRLSIESRLPEPHQQRHRSLVDITRLRSSASQHLDNLQTSWGSVEPSESLSIFTREGEQRRRQQRRRRRKWRQRAKRRKKRAKKDRKHKSSKQDVRDETDDDADGNDDHDNNDDNDDAGNDSLSWAEKISKGSTKGSHYDDKDLHQIESVAACQVFRNMGSQRNLIQQQTRLASAVGRVTNSLRVAEHSSQRCNNTVDQVVETTSALSTLRYMLRRADLTHLLSCTGPLTLLAPTNGAWERAFNATMLTNLLRRNQLETLRAMLLTHILPGRVADDSSANVKLKQSLSGQFVSVRLRNNGHCETFHFNGIAATVADTNICNGVVYLVDSVIGPDNHAIEEPKGMFRGTGLGQYPFSGVLLVSPNSRPISFRCSNDRTISGPADRVYHCAHIANYFGALVGKCIQWYHWP